jgi:protein-tyrosine phosphatase
MAHMETFVEAVETISAVDVYNSPLCEYMMLVVHCAPREMQPIPTALVPASTTAAQVVEEIHEHGCNVIGSRYLQRGVVLYNEHGEAGGLVEELVEMLLKDIARGFSFVKTIEGGLRSFYDSFPSLCEAYAGTEAFVALPAFVCPHLFVGSQMCVNPVAIKGLHIQAILNAGARGAPRLPGAAQKQPPDYLFLDFEDAYDVQLAPFIEQAIPFIRLHVNAGRNVLVHCQMGISRSVSLLVAFLMRERAMSFNTAMTLVQKARHEAEPNLSFTRQLRALQTTDSLGDTYKIDFNVHLRDINPNMIASWQERFAGHERKVTVSCGDIFGAPVHGVTAIVSPANSFGFMDGGIDLAYSRHFGWGLQTRLQKLLAQVTDQYCFLH